LWIKIANELINYLYENIDVTDLGSKKGGFSFNDTGLNILRQPDFVE